MSEPAKQFDGLCDPSLLNAAVTQGVGTTASFRNPIPSTSSGLPPGGPPELPPRPTSLQQNYGYNQMMNPYGGMGSSLGTYGSFGGHGYGGYGGGYGMGGYGMGYGMGMSGMSPYGGLNGYGPAAMESRFIQVAEESSRPTFESIHSFVSAVGSVAMMMENTFFALTSSFRAILGVAENFGRLRSLFAQFWSTFAVFRSINWLIRKLLVMLGIRTESEFRAWAEAVAATQNGAATPEQRARGSGWPILLFFGIVTAAPYIMLRMMKGLSSSLNERLEDPKSWQNPLRAIAQHNYQASSPQEISFNASQVLTLAPQHLQGQLWNSGWVMASTDRQTAGLVPVTYLKVIKPTPVKQSEKENEKSQPSAVDLNKFYSEEL